MTYWRMTKPVRRHPAIAPDEKVIHACYGLGASIVAFANRAASRHVDAWNDEMGEAEGLASPLNRSGVLALTDRRLIFFRKRFAIGRPKTIQGEWPLDQVVSIRYDKDDNTLMVLFEDGSSSGLHVPSNQSPAKLVDGFATLKD